MKEILAKVTKDEDGHWYADEPGAGEREDVFFTATATLPRAGEQQIHYVAHRYTDYKGHWGDWRIQRSSGGLVDGVGPKTLEALRESVAPQITEWLNSEHFDASRKVAVAQFIARQVKDSRYGTDRAQEALNKHKEVVSEEDSTRLQTAISCLDAAYNILETVGA